MISLSEIADVLSGELKGADASFDAISTDSRGVNAGQLFVALSGEHFDAHDYLDQVQEKGACAAIVSRFMDLPLPQILVSDTLIALGQLGAFMASQQRARFIALTGSCGKTTTKEMIRLALSSVGQAYATKGNLNNHIGVPLTLAEVSDSDDFAVIEMGASGVGEIQYTVSMTNPEVVLITNASEAHVEGFGSLENIVQAKGEIVRYAPEDAVVILNADDAHYRDWVEMAGSRQVFSFSSGSVLDATVHLVSKEQLSPVGYRLQVSVSDVLVTFDLPVAGEHMIQNALATLAVVDALKLDVKKAAFALEAFAPVKGRFYPISTERFTVWDDTYNANPESVKAAIETISSYQKPCWLVLGNMAELGSQSKHAHTEIGEFAQTHQFERVYAIGADAQAVIDGRVFEGRAYEKAGMDRLLLDIRKDIECAAPELQILVKGSRSAGMERVVQALIESNKTK